METNYLVLFFFLLLSISIVHSQEPIPEFFINITHVSPQTNLVIPNIQNTFSVAVFCVKASPQFMQGDIVNFNVTLCADALCQRIGKFDLLYKNGCFLEKQYQYFVQAGTQNVSVSIGVKRFDEPEISYIRYAESSFETYKPPPPVIVQQKPKRLGEQVFFGFLSIPIIALFLFIIGVVLIAFKKIAGVVLILFGILIFVFGLVF